MLLLIAEWKIIPIIPNKIAGSLLLHTLEHVPTIDGSRRESVVLFVSYTLCHTHEVTQSFIQNFA